MAQQVKNLPAMEKTQKIKVQSLAGENPLEEETATHSSSLAWKIPWTEEPGGLQSTASQRVRHDRVLSHSIVFLRHISHQPAWIKPTLTAAHQGPVTQWEAKSTSAYLDFPCPVIDQDPQSAHPCFDHSWSITHPLISIYECSDLLVKKSKI